MDKRPVRDAEKRKKNSESRRRYWLDYSPTEADASKDDRVATFIISFSLFFL